MWQLKTTRFPVATYPAPHMRPVAFTTWGRDDRNSGATFLDSDLLQGPWCEIQAWESRAQLEQERGWFWPPQVEHCSALTPRLTESGGRGSLREWKGPWSPPSPASLLWQEMSHTLQVCASFLGVGLGS